MVEAYLTLRNPVHRYFNGTDTVQREVRPNGVSDGYIDHDVMDTNHPGAARIFGTVYHVNDPTQIKSAISNTGEFSDTNTDIRYSTPRVIFNGDELGEDKELLRVKAREIAKKFSDMTVTIDDDGTKVLIPWQSIKHGTSGSVTLAEALAATKLDQLIKSSFYVSSKQDESGRKQIKAYHYYDVPILVGTEDVVIRLVIREDHTGHRYYDHSENRGNVLAPGSENLTGGLPGNPHQLEPGRDENAKASTSLPSISEFDTGIKRSTTRILGDSGRTYTPEQEAMFKRVGREINPKSTVERIKEWANKSWTQGLFDQFAPIKDISTYAYRLVRQSKGAAGAMEAFMHHGKLSIVDGTYDADRSGGVMQKVFFPLGKEVTDFLYWIAGNRAERLAMEGKERLFSLADTTAAKSLANGDLSFDYTLANGTVTRNREAAYKDSLVKFNEMSKNVLDMAEQSGLIDKASRHLWEHEFYVPFYRVADETDGGVRGMNIKKGIVRQKAFEKLKGGTDKMGDLLENTLMNWAHLIDASAKNRAAEATIIAAENAGAAVAAPHWANHKGAVWFMKDGKQMWYKVEDSHLMTALEGLDFAGMKGPIWSALAKPKHWLTMGVTASPFFKVRNLIRDSLQAIGTSDLSYNALGNLKQGWELTNKANQEYVSALAGGGLIRFGTMLEGNEAARTRKLIQLGADPATILDSQSKVMAFGEKILTAYNELGNRGEEINRMALYHQLRKQGVSHGEASLQARDLMDFSMQGSFDSIRILTQVVPFFNARLQGMHKLGRAAKEDPAKMAIVTMAVAVASLALLAANHDDDDWKKRENWDRDTYWWFKIGSTAYRIPKPFEIGAIATIAERSAEAMFDREMTGKQFRTAVFEVVGNQLSMNPVPQAVKPIIDLYANKDSFTGRPIESMSMEKLRPEYRFNSGTSMLARGASTATGGLLSPVQIDHLVQGYFSWLGALAVSTADIAVRSATNEPTKPAMDYFKTATGGMVASTDSAGSRYVSQMYDQAKEIEQAYGTWHQLAKEGKSAEANQFRQDNIDVLRKYPVVETIKRTESKLSERIRMIERSSKDPDEKRELINGVRKQQDQLARRLSPA